MISIDTNIFFYALNPKSTHHIPARQFIQEVVSDREKQVVITDYVLAELYNLLRNPAVMSNPLGSEEAVEVVTAYSKIPNVKRVENAPVMNEVWKLAATKNFARRRLFDVRLALTLQHHGVTEFATANVKDFQKLGFNKVWNPLVS